MKYCATVILFTALLALLWHSKQSKPTVRYFVESCCDGGQPVEYPHPHTIKWKRMEP